jgi:hypothetical protein
MGGRQLVGKSSTDEMRVYLDLSSRNWLQHLFAASTS